MDYSFQKNDICIYAIHDHAFVNWDEASDNQLKLKSG